MYAGAVSMYCFPFGRKGKEYMTTILSVIYGLIFFKVFFEIFDWITYHSDISVFGSSILFCVCTYFAVIILIPLSVFLAEKTTQFIQAHWR